MAVGEPRADFATWVRPSLRPMGLVARRLSETAEVLGVRPGTVKSHLFDARARMRDWLEPSS